MKRKGSAYLAGKINPVMIQRIQTIYLLLGSLFLFATALPFAGMISLNTDARIPEGAELPIFSDRVYHLWEDAVLVWIFLALSAILGIASLLSFRQLNRQLKLAFYAFSLAIFALPGLGLFKPFMEHRLMEIPRPGITPGLGLLLWLAALITYYLAIRAIKKDQKLIRSMDRLR
jgi:hypothetical protein